jgi:hypothetical protein
MLKKRELLRKTNYNFIKIDLNFPATLASPSFELATLGIKSKTLNPTATEAYTKRSFKLRINTANVIKNPKSLKLPGSCKCKVHLILNVCKM